MSDYLLDPFLMSVTCCECRRVIPEFRDDSGYPPLCESCEKEIAAKKAKYEEEEEEEPLPGCCVQPCNEDWGTYCPRCS